MRTPTRSTLVVALVFIGCPDAPVNDDDATLADDDDDSATPADLDGDGYTTGGGDCDDTDAAIHPDAEELCDGIDNDCDGFVDEDFVDSDGDGAADCIDDCNTPAPEATWYGITGSCPWEGEPAPDPWDIVVEWQWGYPQDSGSWITPAVVNLTDDNDDGAVDERDVPDIVVNTLYPLEDRPDLLALHGDGSGVIFGVYGVDPQSGIAVADIDLDGLPEVVTVLRWFVIAPRAEVVAYGHDGSEEWRSEPFDYDGENDQGIAGGAFGHPYLTVSDVDQDGVPEVVTPWAIFDGMTGATEVVLDEYYDDYINHVSPHVRFFPATADLDHDGFVEILLEDSAYEADGTQIWEDPSYPETTTIISSAVADLSGDANAEVITTAMTTTRILAADGTLVSTLPEMSPESHIESCLPAIADFDGDGEMEIAIAGKYDVVVTEVNGTPVWTSHDRFDPSGAAGCSAFDFDVDGAYELLCGDELDFRIHDGRTGAVLYLWADHASATGYEYPVVADVDGDGSAEIVLACNEQLNPEAPCKGIAVLGHADNAWPPAGPVWSVHDYTPMRIRPDGRVESELIAPWSIHNMFLARPPGDGLADLMPIEGETCLASCEDGPWEINWAVANQGLLNQREPISVALYAVEGETEILIAVHQVDEVEYGYQAPGERFELTPDQWGDGIRIVVDDDGTGVGTVDECDEGNNVLEIAAPACP